MSRAYTGVSCCASSSAERTVAHLVFGWTGIGKTSLAKSIAAATGRPYVDRHLAGYEMNQRLEGIEERTSGLCQERFFRP